MASKNPPIDGAPSFGDLDYLAGLGVPEALRRALVPVLRDIVATRAPRPRFRSLDEADQVPDVASVMLRGHGGHGAGVTVTRDGTDLERTLAATEQVQDWVIGQLQPHSPTNWPACPRHPDTHPLWASARDGAVVWSCPRDEVLIAPVGALDELSPA